MKQACAVTGATGYVGSRLAAALAEEFEVVPLTRKPTERGIAWTLTPDTNIAEALRERSVKVLVHSAWDFAHPKAADNWRANVEGSLKLYADAKAAGVE